MTDAEDPDGFVCHAILDEVRIHGGELSPASRMTSAAIRVVAQSLRGPNELRNHPVSGIGVELGDVPTNFGQIASGRE